MTSADSRLQVSDQKGLHMLFTICKIVRCSIPNMNRGFIFSSFPSRDLPFVLLPPIRRGNAICNVPLINLNKSGFIRCNVVGVRWRSAAVTFWTCNNSHKPCCKFLPMKRRGKGAKLREQNPGLRSKLVLGYLAKRTNNRFVEARSIRINASSPSFGGFVFCWDWEFGPVLTLCMNRSNLSSCVGEGEQ